MRLSNHLLVNKATGTFEELIHLWQTQPYAVKNSLTDYNWLFQNNPSLEMMLGLGPCITMILDVRTGKYIFVSNNIKSFLGYSAKLFAKKGIYNIKDLIHPDDSKSVWGQTYKCWHDLLALPAVQRRGYRYNRTFRLQKANGCYVWLLEQNTIWQTDVKGNPTHVLSICSDVSEIMETNTVTDSLKPVLVKKQVQNRPIPEKLKPLNLSKREREIVKLVAQGYSSKLIADQLYISFHTVNTHRRNIIEKTHSKNASGLVQYAISNRII